MPFPIPKMSYRRLRITAIIILVVLICVPVAMAGLALFWFAEGAITHEVEDRLTSLAADRATRLVDWVDEREFDLGAIGHLESLNRWARRADQGDPAAGDSLAAILERVRRVFGGRYLRFAILGNNGDWRFPDTVAYPSDPAVLSALQSGLSHIETNLINADSSRSSIRLWAPVVDADGSRRAFLLATVPPAPLYELLHDVYAGSRLDVVLMDSMGAVLYRPDGAMGDLQQSCPTLRGKGAKSNSISGIVRCAHRSDSPTIGAFQHLPRLGWTVLVAQDYSEVFGGLNRLRWMLWLTMGVIFLLAGGASTVAASLSVRTLERREAELRTTNEQLITADRLASVGMMAASVAHEINNPLTTIKVLIHSLREQTPPGDIKNSDLGIVAGEIDKIKALVLRFLQFARPREPEFSSVRLDEILTRIASLMRPQAQINRIEITEQYGPKACAVWADGSQIGQVFVNILLNALEASPEGGEIRLSTAKVAPDSVAVTIWNSGPGLPDELRERIFEPFFSTKPTGTGLGLSIAHIIVDSHQGTLSAQGHGENGTSFIITLRCRNKESDNAPRSDR